MSKKKKKEYEIYPLCQITLSLGVDSCSPSGFHYVAFCIQCDQFLDSNFLLELLNEVIDEHRDWHNEQYKEAKFLEKKRS